MRMRAIDRWACIAILVASSIQPSFAATKIGELLDEESGTVYELYDNEDGTFTVWQFDPDGTNSIWEFGGEGNPNPADGSGSGAPTPESIEEYIRKHHKGKLSKGVQTNNPLTLKRSSQGKGLDPRWNPAANAKEGVESSGGPSSNSGSTAEWLKNKAKRGSNSEQDDDNTGTNSERPDIGTTGSIRPEVVNPVPVQ